MTTEDQPGNAHQVQVRPSVFVSYAHRDGTAIARRIIRSLEPYCSEVFWDQRMRAGDWRQQLAGRIQSHNFFLVVMSPAQAASEMCQWELGLAQERLRAHGTAAFEIVPIKRFADHHDVELEKFQYADFSRDFDRGFGDLTQIMFGIRRTSWEYVASEPARVLLAAIQSGYVPSLIVFEACDRLIMQKVWTHLAAVLRESQPHLIMGDPQSPQDLLPQIGSLLSQAASLRDASSCLRLRNASELIQAYIECRSRIDEGDYEAAGRCASDLVRHARGFLTMDAAGRLSAGEVASLNAFYPVDIAGFFRQAIAAHVRNMRLLY